MGYQMSPRGWIFGRVLASTNNILTDAQHMVNRCPTCDSRATIGLVIFVLVDYIIANSEKTVLVKENVGHYMDE